MSVVSATFQHSSRNWTGSVQPDNREITAVWCVDVTDEKEGPANVIDGFMSLPDTPAYGALYGGRPWTADNLGPWMWPEPEWTPGNDATPAQPLGAWLVATIFNADRIESNLLRWLVTVTFTEMGPYKIVDFGTAGFEFINLFDQSEDDYGALNSYTGVHVLNDLNLDPLLRPTRCRILRSWVLLPFTHAFDGTPVLNSAGMPFDPPLMKEVPLHTFTFTRNEWPRPEDKALEWRGVTNSTPWLINGVTILTDHARMLDIDIGDTQMLRGQPYCQVTYTIEYNPGSWIRQPLDQGMRHVENNEWVHAIDGHGQSESEPVNLDGAGGLLSQGQPPVFLSFREADAKDFNALKLAEMCV